MGLWARLGITDIYRYLKPGDTKQLPLLCSYIFGRVKLQFFVRACVFVGIYVREMPREGVLLRKRLSRSGRGRGHTPAWALPAVADAPALQDAARQLHNNMEA